MKKIKQKNTRKRKKYLDLASWFSKLQLTTNVNFTNANHQYFYGYICAAGVGLCPKRHSWLSVAFPGISFLHFKDNHL